MEDTMTSPIARYERPESQDAAKWAIWGAQLDARAR